MITTNYPTEIIILFVFAICALRGAVEFLFDFWNGIKPLWRKTK